MKKTRHNNPYEKPAFNNGVGVSESIWDIGQSAKERKKAIERARSTRKKKNKK